MSDREDAMRALAEAVPLEHSAQEQQLAQDVKRHIEQREALKQEVKQP
jgi:hypothetical protein